MSWSESIFIFKTTGEHAWSRTHTQVPSALVLPDRIRVYYATRDDKNRSLTSFIDVARNDPARILYVHDRPVMGMGKPGAFDEDGVMVNSLIMAGNEIRLYYSGWSRTVTVPYRVSIGVARSLDGGVTFERVFEGPIVDRTTNEPYNANSPFVINDNGCWRMWYGSGTGWVEQNGRMEPLYIIKYAESKDGLIWQQDNITCIHPLHPLEANTRASVIKSKRGYEMWFCYRDSVDFRDGKGAYRIGYAISQDAKSWVRQPDPPELAPAAQDWNNRMMTYPNVVEVDGKRIMFLNGNSFGQTGFGYCVWQGE